MKHVHYDMIVAKAANMDLVKFVKLNEVNDWEVASDQRSTNFYWRSEYFLCLPQHKEACLHWLNGGDVLVNDFPDEPHESKRLLKSSSFSSWHGATVFMSDKAEIRIKPKKEKRWIVFSIDSESVVTTFDNPMIAKDSVGSDSGYQIIEIEVEVSI